MALKIVLKPHERMIFGGAVVTNGNTKCELLVETKVPILRERDILKEEDASTHCQKIYFMIQLMYIDEKNLIQHHSTYWKLVQELVKAVPSTLGIVDQISETIISGQYYKAMKTAKKLIAYESTMLDAARSQTK